jgi:exopolysaccharide biosynthesis polyprenyl glycosylphosphotransferase
MISQRVRGVFSILTFVQILLALIVFWGFLGALKVFYIPEGHLSLERYIIYSFLVFLSMVFSELMSSQNDSIFSEGDYTSIHVRSMRQLGFVATGLLLFLVAAKDPVISRTFLFIFLLLLYVVLLFSNRFLPGWLAQWMFKHGKETLTLLVDTSDQFDLYLAWLQKQKSLGVHITGLVTHNPSLPRPDGLIQVLAPIEDLEKVATQHATDLIIVLGFPQNLLWLRQVILFCERRGIRLLILSDFQKNLGCRFVIQDDHGAQILGLRSEPLENPFSRAIKRLLDIAISLPIVCFVLPCLTLAIWIFQVRQSPGPVFYTQRRGGRNQRPFNIIKYRTMHVHMLPEEQQATREDVRIYPAGRWLRKYSMDELPQFVNVLYGDMSVVGPRPHLLEHDEAFALRMNNYRMRSLVKPGITGLAQVRGFRGETKDEASLKGRIESDLEYMENWSLFLDIWIVLQTLRQLLFPAKTAY